ncbi:MAG: MFS transporter [Anaerolineae bacterium]
MDELAQPSLIEGAISKSEERGFGPVLRNRHFLRLWAAQVSSQTAQNGIHFVQIITIEELTRSSGQIGIMILAFSLPAVLFSAIAGIVVDRFSNKLIMVTSNFCRILTAIGYIVSLHTLQGKTLLVAIYALTFVASAIGQFFSPAEVATIPLLLGRERLLAANSLFNFTFISSQVVGLILLFPLTVKLGNRFGENRGIDFSFGLVAFMYIAATILVSLLPRDEPGSVKGTEASALRRAWSEVSEGWSFVRSHPTLHVAIMQLTLVATLVMVLVMLAPGFATRVLQVSAEDAIYIFAPAGAGMLLGALLVGRFGHNFKRDTISNTGLLAMSLTLAGLALAGWASTSKLGLGLFTRGANLNASVMVLALFMGIDFALISIPAQTVVQERAPTEIRGRVIAVQFMLANLVGIPPMLFIGTLADRLGIPQVSLLVALGVLAIGCLSLYYSRKMLEPVRKVETDELAEV